MTSQRVKKSGAKSKSAKRTKPKHVFETDRLRVFHVRNVRPTDSNLGRDVYFAIRTDEERVMVTVNAVLLKSPEDYFVDWLEVASEYRRQGFATEFLEELETFVDRPLRLTPGSPDGEAFLETYFEDD